MLPNQRGKANANPNRVDWEFQGKWGGFPGDLRPTASGHTGHNEGRANDHTDGWITTNEAGRSDSWCRVRAEIREPAPPTACLHSLQKCEVPRKTTRRSWQDMRCVVSTASLDASSMTPSRCGELVTQTPGEGSNPVSPQVGLMECLCYGRLPAHKRPPDEDAESVSTDKLTSFLQKAPILLIYAIYRIMTVSILAEMRAFPKYLTVTSPLLTITTPGSSLPACATGDDRKRLNPPARGDVFLDGRCFA